MKKFFKFILGIIVFIFILIAILEIAFILTKDQNGVTSVSNYVFVPIEDDTMEPTIMASDLIVEKKVNSPQTIKQNDVISYVVNKSGNTKEIKTSRVVQVSNTNGSLSFIVKGDNQGEIAGSVAPENVIGLFTNTKVLFAGGLFAFLGSRNGFLICIIIPLIFLFIYQILKLIIAIATSKKVKEDSIEETKEEIKAPNNEEVKTTPTEEPIKEQPVETPSSEEIKPEQAKEENIVKEPTPIPEKEPVEQPNNISDDSELDIPIVVNEPIFSEPAISSIDENTLPTNIENTPWTSEDMGNKEEVKQEVKEEEEIEIL